MLIASLFAWPVAYFAMQSWLRDFAYCIPLERDWWTFILATAMTLVIAVITVGYQAVRAALANPVEALRYE